MGSEVLVSSPRLEILKIWHFWKYCEILVSFWTAWNGMPRNAHGFKARSPVLEHIGKMMFQIWRQRPLASNGSIFGYETWGVYAELFYWYMIVRIRLPLLERSITAAWQQHNSSSRRCNKGIFRIARNKALVSTRYLVSEQQLLWGVCVPCRTRSHSTIKFTRLLFCCSVATWYILRFGRDT